MSVSVGGLGLMSLRNPFAELVGMVLGKTDLRSMFCLTVFFIVTSVLAYLTNPTENSFRAYLTEQSFRQHLSRLDDNVDDDHTRPSNSGGLPPSRRSTLPMAHGLSYDNSTPFHFANSASISLKTPKHVFHSFGIFTIAAMVPMARSAQPNERETLIISDSWYFGAFGRWWRGGIIEAWYQDVIARSKDEESWSSGILSVKNLDRPNEYNGLPFSTKNLPPHLLSRGSPPRLRNREKAQKPSILPPRSSTPPPLPKSASLPLHTARLSTAVSDRPPINATQPIPQNHGCAPDQVRLGSSLISRSPSTLFDQSPRIAEVLRQISHSKTTVFDLRTQISDCQSAAAQSHNVLLNEVDSFRERKRQEDGSKLETKSRTKVLEDSKRNAESLKREAEKKLKTAQTDRDNATRHMDHLEKEIARLQQRSIDDEATMHQSMDTVSEAERELAEALERKKQEIKVAEDIVTVLNQRARELEEKLTEEKERITLLKESNQARQIELSSHSDQAATSHEFSWPTTGYPSPNNSANGPPTPEVRERRTSSVGFEAVDVLSRRPSISVDTTAPPNHVIRSPSNLKSSPIATYSNAITPQVALRANGYSIFDGGVLANAPQPAPYSHHPTAFSPFGDLDGPQPNGISVVSPTSQSLIPSGLITSLDNNTGLPRSFQSESDVYMDREWRNNSNGSSYKQHVPSQSSQDLVPMMMTASPISPHGSSHSMEHDPFEVRFMQNESDYIREFGRDQQVHNHLREQAQRTSWTHTYNSDSRPIYSREESDGLPSLMMEKASSRRWFAPLSKEKPKKGLNPDAKVFSLAKKSPPKMFATGPTFNVSPPSNPTATYDALNPNGLSSSTVPVSTSVTNSFTRAFAPSPAEREALQRALGGSTNASFERLPSLSDVGSMPSSPSHVSATAVPHHLLAKMLPAWLQSIPPRKAKFSPWEDEEPETTSNGNGGRRR